MRSLTCRAPPECPWRIYKAEAALPRPGLEEGSDTSKAVSATLEARRSFLSKKQKESEGPDSTRQPEGWGEGDHFSTCLPTCIYHFLTNFGRNSILANFDLRTHMGSHRALRRSACLPTPGLLHPPSFPRVKKTTTRHVEGIPRAQRCLENAVSSEGTTFKN